ncbi:MAG TPA: PAS domain S-box protein [Methanomassiliicoccales archaeon]|jgi:PAS domain S-box-containing protein
MRLRSKTFLVTGMIMLAMVIVLAGFSSIVLSQGYTRIEEKDCTDNVQRIISSLKNQENQLERNVYDWAVWDVAYQYAEDHNADFETNDLDNSSFTNLKINAFVVVDSDGSIVNVTFFDLGSDTKIAPPRSFMDHLVPDDPMLVQTGDMSGVSGIVEIDGRPLMVSSHAILTSQAEGPSHGQLIMGRYLDTTEIEIIEGLTGSKFTLLPINDPIINSELSAQDQNLVMTGNNHVEIINESSIAVFSSVKDVSGQYSMIIRSEMNRDVYLQGQTTLGYLNAALIVVGLMFTLVSVLFIERFITSRVRRLDGDVAMVRDDRSFDKRVRIDGRDELSTLSVSINQMLDSLHSSESEVHKSEDRYRMVVEDQTDLIFRIDQDLKITFANGQYCIYFGKEAGKVIGDSSLTYLCSTDRAGFLMKAQSLIGTNEVLSSEFNVIDNRGRERTHQWTLRGIPNDSGPGEIQVVGNDVTEKKQIEEDLRKHRENLEELVEKRTEELLAMNRVLESEIDRRNDAERDLLVSEERYRDLVNNQGEGIVLVDDKGRVTFSNPAADDVFGIQKGKLVDLKIMDFTDDEGRKKLLDEVNGNKVRSTYRWTLLRPDGARKTLLVTATPRKSPEGQYLGMFAIFRDITDNDLMEQALRKREAEYRSVVEDQTDLISRVLLDGTITFVNGAFCRFFGKRMEDLVGRVFELGIPEGEENDLTTMMSSLTPENPTSSWEFRLIRADGKMRWMQTTFRGIFDTDGNILEVQSVGRDISERIQMEQEMLRGQRLESLGTLAGGIAHDFNNVLTSIVGNVTLIKMKIMENDPLMVRLAETESEIIRAKKLADKLLTFSEGGEPVKEVQDIHDIVQEAVGSGLVGSLSTVHIECPQDIDLVQVDKGQMVHAIGNLVRNASEAMDGRGEIIIRIANFSMERNKNGHPSGKYVTLSVSDQGPGISIDNLDRVFDPYFSTKGLGKGLGLSTALSITNRHGGWIDVETAEGRGTTFVMNLPSALLDVSKETVAKKNVNTGSRVLLMDDEESILEVGKELLEASGFIVDTAKDGREAIDLYVEAMRKGKGYDAVIMDLTIRGGMGGKEAIVELLRVDPKAVAIVSSGYSNDPVMAEYRKFGFSGVVQKPYLIKDMVEMIRSVTKDRNS